MSTDPAPTPRSGRGAGEAASGSGGGRRGEAQPRWAVSPGAVARAAFWGLLFLLVAYLPLQNAALWSHVALGDWILDHRSLPEEDPLMPLAEGMPLVDTAWLSEVILAAAHRAGGGEALSLLFALAVVGTYVALGRAFARQADSAALGLAGVALTLVVSWVRWRSLHPETFGALCFALLLLLLVSRLPGDDAAGRAAAGRGAALGLWLGVPALFAVWVNLHDSFAWGLAVVGCFALGRALEVGFRSRSLRRVVDDPRFRRRLVLLEVAAAATLANPYGLALHLHRFGDRATPALLGLPGWQPLSFAYGYGLVFALCWVALWLATRFSRQRVPAAHGALLVVFGVAATAGAFRLPWFAPVWVLVMMPHLAALAARLGEARRRAARWRLIDPGANWRYTAIGGMVVVTFLSLTPWAAAWMGRPPRAAEQLLGRGAPLGLAEYLHDNPPRGQVFNPIPWGGWLRVHGPPALKVFATPEAYRLPTKVWQDYLRVQQAGFEWTRLLALYGAETAILDRAAQASLANAMQISVDWDTAWQDEQAAVFVRVAGRAAAPAEDAAEETADEEAHP